MPLTKSGSRAAIGKNISEMRAAGHPRAQSIAAALSTARRYAKKANGGRVGYAEGGAPREAPLLDTGPIPGQEWAPGDIKREMSNLGGILAEQTGLPSIYRGAGRLVDPESSPLDRWRGAGEVTTGAMPGMGLYGRGLGMLYGSIPRAAATSGFLAGPDIVESLLPRAQAGEAQESPTLYQGPARPKPEVRVLQKELKDAGYDIDVDGVDKEGTRRAELAWKKKQADEARKLKMDEDRLKLQTQQSEVEGGKTKAALAKTTEETAARKATETRKADADKARNKVTEEESPYVRAARTLGPWLGVLPGMFLGSKLANWGGERLTAGARQTMNEANSLLKGDPRFADKLGLLNEFASKGQRTNPQNMFLRDDKARKPPFWKANPEAPQSSALYPPAKGREYALGAALPATLGGIEMGTGGLGAWYYGNQAGEATKALNDPAATTADILGAAAHRDSAENKAAIAEGLMRMGMGTAGYGGIKSVFDTFMRPSMRPNVAKADAWRNDLAESIAKTRAKEAGKAAAKKSGQSGDTAPTRGRKKPNGSNGAAPLLPLAAAPVLSGERLSEEPSPLGSEPASLFSSEDYASGGEVKHHSHYQPRDRQARFRGGPVYPKPNAASLTSKGYGSRTPDSEGDFKRGGSVGSALAVARKYASGGKVHTGAINGPTPGRADKVPMSVRSGSFIWPADVVAGRGQGNNEAGQKVFAQLEKNALANAKTRGVKRATGGNVTQAVPIQAAHGERSTPPEVVEALGDGDIDLGHRICEQILKLCRAEDIKILQTLPGPSR